MMKNLASRTASMAAWGLLLAGLGLTAHAQGNDNGRGRHKQLYAVPAPGKVVIDGKLDDWDLSGRIEMFVIQATRGTMNAKFAVMYDADAFYIGADVGGRGTGHDQGPPGRHVCPHAGTGREG